MELFAILTHEAGWESHVGSDLAINLNGTLLDDLLDFVSCDGVLESVS